MTVLKNVTKPETVQYVLALLTTMLKGACVGARGEWRTALQQRLPCS